MFHSVTLGTLFPSRLLSFDSEDYVGYEDAEDGVMNDGIAMC